MRFLKIEEIKPQGWLKRQLEIQADGLSGHLDKLWPDIKDSKWIGGDRDGWERVPYWLDGFIPLAYLLNDDDKKRRAKKYVDAILERQQEDGWLCPCSKEERLTYDLWALFLVLKVLVVYADCSDDERIEECVYRALKQLYGFLKGQTLSRWAAARWYECLISMMWLYERRPEPWLKELAKRLRAQGIDYSNASALWSEVSNEWSFETHVVNAAMALKGEALYATFMGEERKGEAEKLYGILKKHHGTAYGHFTGDECLGGVSPVRGTELCGVVEAMYSYELLFHVTGNPFWGELLEELAFNALPATVSADMWTHQYDQMSNQIACIRFPDPPVFGTNGVDSNRFGLEPNFGCCTANFNQGWPKFARSVIGRGEDGFTVLSCVPCKAETLFRGKRVTLECCTEYPFRNRIVLRVESEAEEVWTLRVRIPAHAKAHTEHMERADGYFVAKIRKGKRDIEIVLERIPELLERPNGLYALRYGALLFALPIKERREKEEYIRDGVERKFPYCDYNIYPEGSWNYAFSETSSFTVTECPYKDAFDRSEPPLKIFTELVPVEWDEEKNHRWVAARTPASGRLGKPQKKYLQPYGATTLRMTELPVLKK